MGVPLRKTGNELKSREVDKEENPVYYRLVEENDLSDVFTDEIITIFQKCLDGLPEEKRRSFLLSNVEGLKYKEVAELLNISEDKVDNNIRFVRKALQSSLKDYLPVILLTFISIKEMVGRQQINSIVFWELIYLNSLSMSLTVCGRAKTTTRS